MNLLKLSNKLLHKVVIAYFAFFICFLSFSTNLNAQVQDFDFSGNSKESYQCIVHNDLLPIPEIEQRYGIELNARDPNGYWYCPCKDAQQPENDQIVQLPVGGRCRPLGTECLNPENPERPGSPGDPGCFAAVSTLRPPALQQLEIWFVRILYVIWALVATLSFFFLVVLGYRYIITRGDVTKITEIRQKIIYYFVGFALVFLAVPILSTAFRLLGINRDVDCYNVDLPAFQFFYADLCTAPVFLEDTCGYLNEFGSPEGKACPTEGQLRICPGVAAYRCTGNVWRLDSSIPDIQ